MNVRFDAVLFASLSKYILINKLLKSFVSKIAIESTVYTHVYLIIIDREVIFKSRKLKLNTLNYAIYF
jgi:hypothetical protein